MYELSKNSLEQIANLKSSRERYVLELRLGIDSEAPQTLQEIAQKLEVTRERVRQIQHKALSKLRNPEINAILLSADISPSLKGTGKFLKKKPQKNTNAMLVKQTNSKPMTMNDCIVITFNVPVSGTDPEDGTSFIANRHKVRAEWARQDGRETLFITDGEIIARWPTAQIELINWPNGTEIPTSPREFSDRMAEIKQKYPKAWSKWSWEEEENLRTQFIGGKKVSEIATTLGRAPGGIFSRLRKIDLISEDAEFDEEIIYNEQARLTDITGSVYDITKALYNFNLSHSNNLKHDKKFSEKGWFLPSDEFLLCQICNQKRVVVLRKHWKNMGRNFHRWAVICLGCNKVGESRDFPPEMVETIHQYFDNLPPVESSCPDCKTLI